MRPRSSKWSARWSSSIHVLRLVLLVLYIAGPRAACAQVLDSLFPSYVAGVGMSSGEAVLSRQQSEYEALGVRAGNFIIRPRVQESLGFDSNPDGVRSGARSSALIETNAAINATSTWSRNSLIAGLTVDDYRYLQRQIEDQTNWTALLGGTYELGRDRIGVTYTHLDLNQSPRDLDSVTVTHPLHYTVEQGQISYTINTGLRMSFIPEFDVRYYRFDNVVEPQTTFGQSYRNRLVADGVLTTRFELAPLRNLVLVLRGTHITYTDSPVGLPGRDSNGAEVLTGIDYSGAGLFRYQALVGYQIRNYESAQIRSISAPVVEASATWAPTRLTTVRVTVRRDIQEAADESVAGYTLTGARLDIDHELLRNVLLHGFVKVEQADFQATTGLPANVPFQQSSSTQTLYNAGLGATWLLNRNLRAGINYTFTTRRGAGTRDFDESLGLVSLTFGL